MIINIFEVFTWKKRESFSDVQKNIFGVVLQFLELSVTKLIIEGNAGILQSQSNFWNIRK